MFEVLMGFALGIISIFSPCILPIIPLIFAGSRGKAINAALVVFGLISSMFIAGFIISLISAYIVKIIAYGFMVFFAIVLLFDELEVRLSTYISIITSRLSKTDFSTLPSFVFGFLLAFLWLPCIAPFAGIAISQAIVTQNPYVMISYGLGMSVTIFTVFKLGEKFILSNFTTVKKIAGGLIILYLLYFILS